jgi:hypothetical protein
MCHFQNLTGFLCHSHVIVLLIQVLYSYGKYVAVRKRKICFSASRFCTLCHRKVTTKIRTEDVDEKLEDGER